YKVLHAIQDYLFCEVGVKKKGMAKSRLKNCVLRKKDDLLIKILGIDPSGTGTSGFTSQVKVYQPNLLLFESSNFIRIRGKDMTSLFKLLGALEVLPIQQIKSIPVHQVKELTKQLLVGTYRIESISYQKGREREISQELNLLKVKLGFNISTTFRQAIKGYLEKQLEENVLNSNPKKVGKELIEGKGQELTLEDIEWQLERVKLFELWLNKQIEGYLILKTRYYHQRKQSHQTKSEEYKKMVENSRKKLNFVKQEIKETMQEGEDKKKVVMRIMKDLEAERKARQKQLAKDYEE
ncbi:8040_t:CDS:2, partial [Funneliformis geosporum]